MWVRSSPMGRLEKSMSRKDLRNTACLRPIVADPVACAVYRSAPTITVDRIDDALKRWSSRVDGVRSHGPNASPKDLQDSFCFFPASQRVQRGSKVDDRKQIVIFSAAFVEPKQGLHQGIHESRPSNFPVGTEQIIQGFASCREEGGMCCKLVTPIFLAYLGAVRKASDP